MHALDAASALGFLMVAAGGALLFEREPSVAGALLPLAAMALGALHAARAGRPVG
jgi:hypothetical protein